jgi:hypothetical protein
VISGISLANEVIDEIVVVSQIRKESLSPWFAMIVGGGDAGVTEAVDFGDDAANRFSGIERAAWCFL